MTKSCYRLLKPSSNAGYFLKFFYTFTFIINDEPNSSYSEWRYGASVSNIISSSSILHTRDLNLWLFSSFRIKSEIPNLQFGNDVLHVRYNILSPFKQCWCILNCFGGNRISVSNTSHQFVHLLCNGWQKIGLF